MQASILPHKHDLSPSNEHDIRCTFHPGERAEMMDLDDKGHTVPLCHACWMARWPVIRARIAEQRLVLGGL